MCVCVCACVCVYNVVNLFMISMSLYESKTLLGEKSKMEAVESATKSNLDGPTKEEQEEMESSYRVAEYYCMLSTAIAGGVESPLQFIFQVSYLCISFMPDSFKRYHEYKMINLDFYLDKFLHRCI